MGVTDPMDPGQLLISPSQAAKRLGIGRSTVYSLLADGRLESVHIGRRRLVPVGAIEHYVGRLRRDQRQTGPTDVTLARSQAPAKVGVPWPLATGPPALTGCSGCLLDHAEE